MVVNAFFMSLLYVIVKILTRNFGFTSSQVGLLYKLSILVLTIMSCVKMGFVMHLKTDKFLVHALRGFFSIMGSLSMFYAVSVMNVLNAAAISELTPTFMVLAGVLLFKEKMNSPKLILLIGSTIGIIFIENFRTLSHGIDEGHFFAFLALIFWSINNVIVKQLTKTERSRAQLFYSSLFAAIFASPFAFFQFNIDIQELSIVASPSRWPSFTNQSILLILSAGVASLLHKFSFFRAYKLSDMSVVGPFDYLRLPFTGIFAYIVFGETIKDTYSLIGYACIILSGMYFIMYRNKN